MKYKNIIFDCGNVLFGFSREFLLNTYVGNDKDKQNTLSKILFGRWEEQDAGKPSKIFYNEIIKELPQELHEAAWNIIFRWPDWIKPFEMVSEIIIKLKNSGHKIYLLSNMPETFANDHSKLKILESFDDLIFSYNIKMIKPSKNIFEYTIKHLCINVDETLFVDDSIVNCRVAEDIGIASFNFDPKNQKDFIDFISSTEEL